MKTKAILITFLFFGVKSFSQNTIATLQPAVTIDTNAVCAGSVIDIPFSSSGTYLSNTYIAQLSDASGNFTNPAVMGSLVSDVAYDPLNPTPGYPPPGYISGLIPDTISPGCNYYIRVIATGPSVVGASWGPFCIQHCDIYFNNQQDVNICLTPTTQQVTQNLTVNIHHYNNTAIYNPGNQFQTQLISMGPFPPPFTQVGANGALGSITATGNSTLQLTIPPLVQLQSLGIQPGRYYLRIVATNSNFSDSIFSNIIRLTIGAPSDTAPSFSALSYPSFTPLTGNTICMFDYVYFTVNSPNPGSAYTWVTSFGNYTQNPFLVLFNNSGTVTVRLQENNLGCLGPLSSINTFIVQGPANTNIAGPPSACVGDTVHYQVPFQNSTLYQWSLNTLAHGHITDTLNNQAWFMFDSAGTYQINVHAVNSCFDTTGHKTITVKPSPPVPSISQNGDTLTSSDTAATYRWYKNGILQPAYTTQSIVISLPADNGSWQVELGNIFGCTSMSAPLSIVGIEELTGENFSVFPNPVGSELKIKNAELRIKNVEIYDAFGQIVLSKQAGQKQIVIDVSALSNGIYFVTVTDKNQNKTVCRVIKL